MGPMLEAGASGTGPAPPLPPGCGSRGYRLFPPGENREGGTTAGNGACSANAQVMEHLRRRGHDAVHRLVDEHRPRVVPLPSQRLRVSREGGGGTPAVACCAPVPFGCCNGEYPAGADIPSCSKADRQREVLRIPRNSNGILMIPRRRNVLSWGSARHVIWKEGDRVLKQLVERWDPHQWPLWDVASGVLSTALQR
eukprot:gene15930-biopygen4137